MIFCWSVLLFLQPNELMETRVFSFLNMFWSLQFNLFYKIPQDTLKNCSDIMKNKITMIERRKQNNNKIKTEYRVSYWWPNKKPRRYCWKLPTFSLHPPSVDSFQISFVYFYKTKFLAANTKTKNLKKNYLDCNNRWKSVFI